MTAAGWIFMLTSWTVLLGLFAFCLVRTLGTAQKHGGDSGEAK